MLYACNPHNSSDIEYTLLTMYTSLRLTVSQSCEENKYSLHHLVWTENQPCAAMEMCRACFATYWDL